MPAPFLIAGPCAAENQTQVVETARQVVSLLGNTVIFRAGVWKPRTNPNTFQGVGEKALLWLQQVQKQTGMAVATEVATPDAHSLDVSPSWGPPFAQCALYLPTTIVHPHSRGF